MNWLDTKFNLTPSTGVHSFGSKKVDNKISHLKRVDWSCESCGGRYKKYLTCIHYKGEIRVLCRACYIILNLNMVGGNEVTVCRSDLSQLSIVQKTVDYILKNGQIPEPKDIEYYNGSRS